MNRVYIPITYQLTVEKVAEIVRDRTHVVDYLSRIVPTWQWWS
jgi:hypothetical protein